LLFDAALIVADLAGKLAAMIDDAEERGRDQL
jgi:hypothetical protein